MELHRQGDVLLMRVESQTGEAEIPQTGDVILALGEVTGHAHRIKDRGAKLWSLKDTRDRLLTLAADAQLTHEEHAAVFLRAGQYRVRIQREWLGEEVRNVAD